MVFSQILVCRQCWLVPETWWISMLMLHLHHSIPNSMWATEYCVALTVTINCCNFLSLFVQQLVCGVLCWLLTTPIWPTKLTTVRQTHFKMSNTCKSKCLVYLSLRKWIKVIYRAVWRGDGAIDHVEMSPCEATCSPDERRACPSFGPLGLP